MQSALPSSPVSDVAAPGTIRRLGSVSELTYLERAEAAFQRDERRSILRTKTLPASIF